MKTLAATYIPSGKYQVGRSTNEVYEAVLGTCVGVAIVDRKAYAGGLYHILLASQSAAAAASDPTLCASSGMPLFLESLRALGCTAENMEAVIAGGALIGEVSTLDLDLDIGGHTVEIVNRQLREAAIPVVHSETGGHFGNKLRLNLFTLRSEIVPAHPVMAEELPAPSPLTSAELGRAALQIKPIPQVALKIIRTIQSNDYSLNEIAREVRLDQVITAKVIKTCNSAYIGAKENIRSLDQAIVMLGGRMVGQLILSSAMDQFFTGHQRGYSMSKGGMYHHAVSTAIVAEHLAKLTKKSESDIAYTAGLLHDIGKVLLDQYVASALPLFYRRVVAEGEKLLDAERSLLGVSHAEAGARLAELWSFPISLRDVIAHHTHPKHAQHDRTLTSLIYLADLLTSRFDMGHELDRIATEDLTDVMRHLGLAPGSLPDLISRIPWKMLATPGYF
jgi:putative nucleotidyltransferase with HDIG domain